MERRQVCFWNVFHYIVTIHTQAFSCYTKSARGLSITSHRHYFKNLNNFLETLFLRRYIHIFTFTFCSHSNIMFQLKAYIQETQVFRPFIKLCNLVLAFVGYLKKKFFIYYAFKSFVHFIRKNKRHQKQTKTKTETKTKNKTKTLATKIHKRLLF